MARRSSVLALAVVAALAAACAPSASAMFIGCTPCSSCTTPLCWQICQPSCSYVPITPSNVVVNGDSCRASGRSYGPTAGASACQTARNMCQAHSGPLVGSARPIGPTTLAQCANIALGSCQQSASVNMPCAAEAEFGAGNCDAATFRAYFTQAANSACFGFAQTVTGVTPGTNNWTPQPFVPIRPFFPGGAIIGSGAPVIGASAPIGGLGAAAPGGGDDDGKRRLLSAGRRMLRAE